MRFAAGQSLRRTLELVREFRRGDDVTPIILMGYYNPIYVYGVEKFLADAKTSGVDGLIIVDLPPEEDEELCLPALKAGFNFIRLATPTTDDRRLPAVLANTSGFVYYVSITGITGAAAPDAGKVAAAVTRIKRHTKLPVCVGFGVRTRRAGAGAGAQAPTGSWSARHWSKRCVPVSGQTAKPRRQPSSQLPIWCGRWPTACAGRSGFQPIPRASGGIALRRDRFLEHAAADLDAAVTLRFERVERFPRLAVGVDDVDFLIDLAFKHAPCAEFEAAVPVDGRIAAADHEP